MTENNIKNDTQAVSLFLKNNLFSHLLPAEKQFVASRSGILQLQKGGLLFSPGNKAQHFYLLKKGIIHVYKPLAGSRTNELARFAPGDYIGDFDFARGADYDAYAEAAEDSQLVLFPCVGRTLESFIPEAPLIVSKILLNSISMVTGRIKSIRKLIVESMTWVQEFRHKIHEDHGTGLWKQSLIIDELNQLLENPISLIMLKPDRFKVLVDVRGHEAGDKAMVKIAAVLKNITRMLGQGWALRFKSNETGILVNNLDAAATEKLAFALAEDIARLPPVPLGNDKGNFSFTGSIVWGLWPSDDRSWDSFFEGIYKLLLEANKAGGYRVVHYKKEQPV